MHHAAGSLSQAIGLNQAEKAILCFVSVMQIFGDFKDAIANTYHKISLNELGEIITHLSGQEKTDVIAALRQDSTLRSSGLIKLSNHNDNLNDRLDLLTGMDSLLTQQHDNMEPVHYSIPHIVYNVPSLWHTHAT